MDTISAWFWTPSFWLPQGIAWENLKSTNRPLASDLLYSIPTAFVLIIVRYLTERCVLRPCAQYTLGRKALMPSQTNQVKLSPHQEKLLKQAFKSKGQTKKLVYMQIRILAKKLDLEIRDIERWLRKRDKENKTSIVDKFSETEWRLLTYLTSTIGALYVLWDKSWLWDVRECWSDGFPDQSVPDDVWWYYILMTGFYISAGITLAFDIKRKDFKALAIHHIVCILLFVLSWISNYIRFGMLVVSLHDLSDILLELAKLLSYAKNTKWANKVFESFIVVWIIARLLMFPFYLLRNFILYRPSYLIAVPIYQLNVIGLLCLLSLNIYWTYFIFLMVYKAASTGEMQDSRSSDESEDETPKKRVNESGS